MGSAHPCSSTAHNPSTARATVKGARARPPRGVDGRSRGASIAGYKCWNDAGLKPLGFHEGRHTFASIGIAAGLNAKTLSTYLGHATITITLDRYGHLMPGSEVEAREMLDGYLASSEG